MKRRSGSKTRTLLAITTLAFCPMPAHAAVTRTPEGPPVVTKSFETRHVKAMPVEVRGEPTILTRQPFSETTVLGPTTKLVTERETRTYQVPFRLLPQTQEEKREVTTSTQRYRVTTPTSVVDRSWSSWMVGGLMPSVHSFTSDLAICYVPTNGDFRNLPHLGLRHGRNERDPAHFNRANALVLNIQPYHDDNLLAHLYFDKNTLAFIGGAMRCHGNYTNIPWAKINHYWDVDTVQYKLDCPINNDWWPYDHCATGDHTWELRLDGRLLEFKNHTTYKTVNKTTFEDKVSKTYGPWTPTGTMIPGTSPLSVRYETATETVLIGQRAVPNDQNTSKALASTGADVRRIFKGDSSSEAPRASLSGSKVRQSLGASQVTPSRAKETQYSGGVASEKPGMGLGRDAQDPGAGGLGGLSAGKGTGGSASGDSWWFPKDPKKPPLRVRFEQYKINR